ncbi:MAG: trypsin-like peptidase domain-containing protein [Anaerolineales bacterium]|nr:trypsin-like peptidase domain-containing protein [Anaerolineales bacterium]
MNEPSASGSERWQERLVRIRTHLKNATPFVTGILAALLAILLYSLLFPGTHQMTVREVNDTVAMALASATPRPAFSTQVFQVIQPSLVLIQTKGEDDEGEHGGLGSGVIITTNGEILTSLHVVAGADEILVTFADGTKSEAEVVLEQPENDIAVLQAYQLPGILIPAILGNPGSMRVGDEAFAVGNPFGLYGSMSAGVISGFNRTFQPSGSEQRLEGLIQVDAAVNPGNSGGPLLNRSGQVIGIVTGIVNPSEQNFFVGIGFAVPINVAVSGMGSPPY